MLKGAFFDVPDFEFYYTCKQAHYAFYWFHPPRYMPQIAAEQWLVDPIPLDGILYAPPRTRDTEPTALTCTADAWRRILTLLQSPMLYSPLLPLSYHPHMPLLQETGFLKLCEHTRITTWGDLCCNGEFRTSEHLFQGLHPSSLHIFLYVRLRQGIRSFTPEFLQEPPTFAPLHMLLRAASPGHLVSILYHTIRTQQVEPPSSSRTKWNLELGYDITDDQWSYCCLQTEQISASARLRITHYKFLQSLYYTPVKMVRFNLRLTDNCARCGSPGLIFYIWPGIAHE